MRLYRSFIFVSVVVAGLILVNPRFARAESESFPDIPELPSDAPKLPEPGASGANGMLINSTNATMTKSLIVPEIYEFLRAGQVEMEAYRSLRYAWRLDDEWEKNSREAQSDLLNENGTLRKEFKITRGFPFSKIEELSKDNDPKRLGHKLLWNISANFWGQEILDTDIDLVWFKDNKLGRRVKANLVRMYPSLLGVNGGSAQLFRERFRLIEPSPINGLTWLTFRFLGEDEDALWIYSPAIQKVRQLTGSNRADPLIKSGLSLDDLFIYSGKPELVDVSVERSLVGLVPFPNLNFDEISAVSEHCFILEKDMFDVEGGHIPRWNYESRKFPQGAAWLPTAGASVPRKLWRLELASRDPYSLYGRQILYVDAVMKLPVYKIVYDRSGHYWKTIIASFGIVVTKDKSRRFPYLSHMIIDDKLKGETYVLDYVRTRYCDEQPTDLKFAELDPSKLGSVTN